MSVLDAIRRLVTPGSEPERRLVLFHMGRVGSTVIAQMLGRHPKIHWDGELYIRFVKETVARPDKSKPYEPGVAIEQPLREAIGRARKPCYGFEMKFMHLWPFGVEMPHFLDELETLGFDRFAVLNRRNALRKIVSLHLRRATGRVRLRAGEKADLTRVTIDVSRIRLLERHFTLLEYLERIEAEYAELERLLAGRETLELSYEEDIATDPRVAYGRICDYLGVEPEPVEVRLGKINAFALREVIENFDEVAATLRGTRFEWMLDAD